MVRAVDADGAATTLDAADFAFEPADGTVTLVNAVSGTDHYEIDFTAGYGAAGADVPQPLRQAIRCWSRISTSTARPSRRGQRGVDAARRARAGGALSQDGAVLSRGGASTPGRLGARLALETATATPDGAGGKTLAWSAVATVWGEVAPLQAGEREVGEGLGDVMTHRIVIRKRSE